MLPLRNVCLRPLHYSAPGAADFVSLTVYAVTLLAAYVDCWTPYALNRLKKHNLDQIEHAPIPRFATNPGERAYTVHGSVRESQDDRSGGWPSGERRVQAALSGYVTADDDI